MRNETLKVSQMLEFFSYDSFLLSNFLLRRLKSTKLSHCHKEHMKIIIMTRQIYINPNRDDNF